MQPRILLINPPIYDFSAYDFWMKPYGLLRVGGMLRRRARVELFDFMDRLHSAVPAVKNSDAFGRGQYFREVIINPETLHRVPRRYKRFGVPRKAFEEFLSLSGPFDFVLINGGLSYWYLGVKEVMQCVRATWPEAKIALGGVYPTISPAHAASLGVDVLIQGSELSLLWNALGISPDLNASPLWEAYPELGYGVIKLTDGCPCNCSYCAVKKFALGFSGRPLRHVLQELDALLEKGVTQIAFYDDALLIRCDEILFPFLDEARRRCPNLVFHTPNALHLRYLDDRTATRLAQANFKQLYLGVESRTAAFLRETGGKASDGDLERALASLRRAGFGKEAVTAYIVFGHPLQATADVEETLMWLHAHGARTMLAEFSPIPGTPDGERCRQWVDLDEPLWHNKTAFPLVRYGQQEVNRLKQLVHSLNSDFEPASRLVDYDAQTTYS